MKQASTERVTRAESPTPPAPLEFRSLYAAEFTFVWRCLGALGVQPANLDDAAQEVFLVVHRRLTEFRGESTVRTWLYEIVRKVASNAKRAMRRKGHNAELSGEEPSRQPGPFERVESHETVAFIQAFLCELDDKKRDVFVLAIIEQLTIPEVATILGIPINTALHAPACREARISRGVANASRPVMREVESDAEAFVEQLRSALSPSDADRLRVLAAVESQLGGIDPAAAPAARGWWRLRAALISPAGLSIVAAFLIGAGVASHWRGAPVAKPSRATQLTAAPAQPALEPAPERQAEAVVSAAPVTTAVLKAASTPVRSRHRVIVSQPAAGTPVRSRHRVIVSQPAAVASAAANEPSTLRIELEALQSAERALRDRQPARALEILNACDRQVPAGRMREERLAASTVARCTLFEDRATALLDQFARVYPHSAYAQRVGRSCVTH
jgi:RNA polymerase sigma-70 factor (ECF subfamily)